MNEKTRRALEAARHELATEQGLIAADGKAPDQKFVIEHSETIKKIDEALASDSPIKKDTFVTNK